MSPPTRWREQSSQDIQKGMLMVDPGSDTNFVRHQFARQLGIKGEPCNFRLKVVDREARPLQTARYTFEIEDKFGTRHEVVAMGLDDITTLPPDPDLTGIQDLVDGYPPEVLQRPQGEVDILLGLRNSALHGSTCSSVGEPSSVGVASGNVAGLCGGRTPR